MMIRFTFSLVMLSTCYASSLITPKDIDGFAQNPMVGIKALLDVKTIDTEGISMEEASQYFRSFEKFCAAAINNGQKDYLSYLAAYPLRDTAFETIIKVQLNNLYFDEIIKSEDFKNKLKENKIRAQLLQGIGKDIKAKEKKIKELTSQMEGLEKKTKSKERKDSLLGTTNLIPKNTETKWKKVKKSVKFQTADNSTCSNEDEVKKVKSTSFRYEREPVNKKRIELYSLVSKNLEIINALKSANTYDRQSLILDYAAKDKSYNEYVENLKRLKSVDSDYSKVRKVKGYIDSNSKDIMKSLESEIEQAIYNFCLKDSLENSIDELSRTVLFYRGDYKILKKHQKVIIEKIVESFKNKTNFDLLKYFASFSNNYVYDDELYGEFWIMMQTIFQIVKDFKIDLNALSTEEKKELNALLYYKFNESNIEHGYNFEKDIKGTVAGLMYKVLKLRLKAEPSPSIKSSEGPVTKDVQDAVEYGADFDLILEKLDQDDPMEFQFINFTNYLFSGEIDQKKINLVITFLLETMNNETLTSYIRSFYEAEIYRNYSKALEKADVTNKKKMESNFDKFLNKYIETFVNRFVPASNLSAQFHAENGSAWLIDTFALFKDRLEKMEKTDQVKNAIIELEKWEENLPKHNREKIS